MSQTQTAPSVNSLGSMVELVKAMPDGPQKLELEYALGLKQRPVASPYSIKSKVNDKSGKPYVVIAMDGAKVQFSPQTAKRILDTLEQLAEAISDADEQLAKDVASWNASKSNGAK